MRRFKARNTRKNKLSSNKVTVASIEDRIAAAARGDLNQILYIGDLVERALVGEFGVVLRALLRGRASNELSDSRRFITSAARSERYLGRLDAYERIIEDLEQYVIDKDKAFKKLAEDNAVQEQPEEIQHAPDIGS